jgi:hypothetical protein
MDIWTYFHQKEAEFRERCGRVPDDAAFEEDEGSEGTSGSVRARIWLADDAYLDVYESVVVVDGNHIHREVYSYALIVNGVHEHGWERDPTHAEMPLHEHDGRKRTPEASGRISFADALELAWERLSSRAIAPWNDDDS